MKKDRVSSIILLSLLCLAFVFIAGCGYEPNRDIVVIKLNPDGTTAWTTRIDTGHDDAANDIIEVPGGDFMLAGENQSEKFSGWRPRLTRLSSDGKIQWDRILKGSEDERMDELKKVISVPGGGYAAVSSYGKIWRVDSNGNSLWNRSADIESLWTITGTEDSGFIIAGGDSGHIPFGTFPVYQDNGTISSREPYPNETRKIPGCGETSLPTGPNRTVMITRCTESFELVRQAMVMKLDTDGNVSWRRFYGAEGLDSAMSVIETPSSTGYLVVGYRSGTGYLVAGSGSTPDGNESRTDYFSAIRLDPNGTAMCVTRLGDIGYAESSQLRSDPDGFDILYNNVDVRLDLNGSVEKTRSIDSGNLVTWTADGGYFFSGIYGPAGSNTLHAIKIGPDGRRVWDHEVASGPVNRVKKVIQTSDGGYAILALMENY